MIHKNKNRATDLFSASIVEYVRKVMPDRAILALVRDRLDEELGGAPASKRGRPAAAVTAPKGPARHRGRPKGALTPEKIAALESVERIVRGSEGISASEVAREAGIPQSRAAAALKELKREKRIFQGGDRRFARYAADSKTAEAASTSARSHAEGPKVGGKRGKKKSKK